MPLKMYFDIGEKLLEGFNGLHRIGEIRPGTCNFFWDIRMPKPGILAAVCDISDIASTIYVLDPDSASTLDRGVPTEIPRIPDEILMHNGVSVYPEVTNIRGVIGTLTLIHFAHPSA